MKLLTLALALFIAHNSHATVIAIVDSGTDLTHKDLQNKKWVNPIDVDDAVDNDDNGYIDDVNGWNFADNNNKLIEKKYLGTFSPDVYKFFEVQTRLLKGEGTDADRAWYNSMKDNTKFISQLELFGNFVHGTHVAGLSAKNAERAQIMVLKIIPTKSPLAGSGKVDLAAGKNCTGSESTTLLEFGLKLLASQQGKGLAPVGEYLASEKARVANCSFGTSANAAKMIIAPLAQLALQCTPTDAQVMHLASYFVGEVVKQAGALIDPSKGKTMFVIAAGNDGMDNDIYPTSPANYKTDNSISVAATLGYKKLASFSNFGATKVEVAAPGVGIESTIPGDQYLTVSGTSQAAPFVTNAVGLMLDQNPNLSNADIKRVLMGTTDLKDFLKGKVVSGGIVNTARAAMTAKLALTMQLADAMDAARVQIDDVHPSDIFALDGSDNDFEGYVMPLPSLFH